MHHYLEVIYFSLSLLLQNSVNARDSKIPYPWLVFNEKIKVKSVFLRDSTAISDSMLLLFGGSISLGDVVSAFSFFYAVLWMYPMCGKMGWLGNGLKQLTFFFFLLNPFDHIKIKATLFYQFVCKQVETSHL